MTARTLQLSEGRHRYLIRNSLRETAAQRNLRQHTLRLRGAKRCLEIGTDMWGGSVIDAGKQSADTRAIRAFNRKLHRDRRVDLSLVPIGDGLALALKN